MPPPINAKLTKPRVEGEKLYGGAENPGDSNRFNTKRELAPKPTQHAAKMTMG